MRVNRTPFTVYDFFGYLLPGCLFLSLLFFSYKESYSLIENVCSKTTSNFVIIFLGISVIFFAYILGHILSYISHLLLEKFLKIPEKFFKNNDSIKKQWLCLELNRKVFNSKELSKHKKSLCKEYLKREAVTHPTIFLKTEKEEDQFNKIGESIALNIAGPYYSQMIYNTLVISGTFRVITLIFAFYALFPIFSLLFSINQFFLNSCRPLIIFIAIIFVLIFSSFIIYCKYLRRYYELCDIVLILKQDEREDRQK